MAEVLSRGDVVWADLNPVRGREQAGRRPVLIVSVDVFNQRSGTVIAMAITSKPQKAGYPLTLKLSGKQLPQEAWVKISQVRTLSTERVGKKLGRVEDAELEKVIDGLNEIIGG
jgi:mRNA interferase MazF